MQFPPGIFPSESSFITRESLPPAPKEFVLPVTKIHSPKAMSKSKNLSSPYPPNVFAQLRFPESSILNTKASSPPLPKETVPPQKIYPLETLRIRINLSQTVPPYVFAHCTLPEELILRAKPS